MRLAQLGSALVATCAVALLRPGAAVACAQQEAGQAVPLVLRVREANLRNDPREGADSIGHLVFREPLVVLERREGWLRVRSESTAVTGWVHRYATYPRAQQRRLAGRPVPTGVVLITDIRDYQGGTADYAFTPSGWVHVASVAGAAARVAAIDVGQDLRPALVIVPGQAFVFDARVRLPAGPFHVMVFRGEAGAAAPGGVRNGLTALRPEPRGRFQPATIRSPRRGVLYYLNDRGAILGLPD
jgi:hypothetical protein